jgi:hypothetical protein
MPNDTHEPTRFALPRLPLVRLLAINLAIGASAAVLLVGGLLLLNPAHIRDLIFADRAPGVAMFLLLGSFLITFGSAAMGSAIMTLGREENDGNDGSRLRLATQKLTDQRP